MSFETHPLLISGCIFILALLLVSFVKSLKDPSSVWVLLIGVALVALGVWTLSGLNITHSFLGTLHDKKIISESQFQEGKQSVELWALLLPAVISAMGANLITSWSLVRKNNG